MLFFSQRNFLLRFYKIWISCLKCIFDSLWYLREKMRYKLSASSFKHTLFICVLCLLINMNNVIFHGIKFALLIAQNLPIRFCCDKSMDVEHILSSLHLFTPLIILLCFICNEMTHHAINYLKHLVYNHISIFEICYDCGNSCS